MNCKRVYGLDLLKILATLLVLVLHINSFVLSQFGKATYPPTTLAIYFFMEAFAYPAIHLFVMIGSYFMIEKTNSIKQITRIWSQTWIVTMSGLIGYLVLSTHFPSSLLIFTCIFPFIGRAYWYVTEYIILILLSPLLNKGMSGLKTNKLLEITLVYGCATCIFPTFFPMFPWYQDVSQMANLLLLYLMTGCVKRVHNDIENNTLNMHNYHITQILNNLTSKKIWFTIWIICIISLTGSAILLHTLNPQHESYLYTYNSPFVMLEALSLFIVFKDIHIKKMSIGKAITWLQSSSLMVYLLHMHPIYKTKYVSWNLFRYFSINSPIIYLIQFFLTIIVLFMLGTIIGKIVNLAASFIQSSIIKMLHKCERE